MIQPRHVAADIKDVARGSQGFINIASDAINVSAKYQNIIENLLGNTIIVENLNMQMNLHVPFDIGQE